MQNFLTATANTDSIWMSVQAVTEVYDIGVITALTVIFDAVKTAAVIFCYISQSRWKVVTTLNNSWRIIKKIIAYRLLFTKQFCYITVITFNTCPSAVSKTLFAFAAEHRAVAAECRTCCWSISCRGRSTANSSHAAVDRWDRQQTVDCFIDPALHTMRAVSVTMSISDYFKVEQSAVA